MAEIQITTTQNVTINFRATEVEKRILAFIIDNIIKKSYMGIVSYLFYLTLTSNNSNFKTLIDTDYWSFIAVVILLLLPVIFYTLVLETLFSGQTLGKKILKMKVVKIDGFRANFLDFFTRWIMRIIDTNLLFGFIAFITILNSKNYQRLGGMASGTAVIDLSNKTKIDHTIFEEINEKKYIPKYHSVIKLSDNDIRIIKESYLGAIRLNNTEKLNLIRDKIINATQISEDAKNIPSEIFIKQIISDYNYLTLKK